MAMENLGGVPVVGTDGRIGASYGVPFEEQEAGFSESIKGMFFPGKLRVVDIFASSDFSPEEQRAIHSYLMRGFRQAADLLSGYDLSKLYAEDINDADLDKMPYPIKRAYWFAVTRLSVDSMNRLTALQAHVGYLLGARQPSGNAMARYQRRMDGRGGRPSRNGREPSDEGMEY